ncbi:MAG: hypothetical protein R2778_19340 [Saprospiraceae bacterium]
MIGPNCPGIITPDEAKVGIMPGCVQTRPYPGWFQNPEHSRIEAADQIAKAGLGISTAIGIGGDPIIAWHHYPPGH